MGFKHQAKTRGLAVLLASHRDHFGSVCALLEAHNIDLVVIDKPEYIQKQLDATPDAILVDASHTDLALIEKQISACARRFASSHIVGLMHNPSMSDKISALTHGAHATWDVDEPTETLTQHIKAAFIAPQSQHTTSAGQNVDTEFEGFVGKSVIMQTLYAQIGSMAPSSAPVFITGESGSGKEVCAQALHKRSHRSDKPFVALNCGAIPADLMESEIFGAVAGAYTGAHTDRIGSAELADGGTLFLDEIGEMELGLQAKLLRFLQTGTINRVGDPHPKNLDVRIICATNRSPTDMVEQGRFRQDLFYRLHVLPLNLPALRERRQDIGALATHFLAIFNAQEEKNFEGFSDAARHKMEQYDWPGNVRELQNMIRRAVIMGHGTIIELNMLEFSDTATNLDNAISTPAIMQAGGSDIPTISPLWQQEQAIIDSAIAAFGGNIAKAAKALEISPSTIYRKKESWRTKAA